MLENDKFLDPELWTSPVLAIVALGGINQYGRSFSLSRLFSVNLTLQYKQIKLKQKN